MATVATRLDLTTRCTFENVIPFKRIPYWLYWLGLSFGLVVANELLAWFLGDVHYTLSVVFFALTMCYATIVLTWLSHGFGRMMEYLSTLLWTDKREYEDWVTSRHAQIFTLRSLNARLITGLIVLTGMTILVSLFVYFKWPFNSLVLNLLTIPVFVLLLTIYGQGAYIFFSLLATLAEIVRRPARLPFFMLPHLGIARLQGYYSVTSILAMVGDLLLVLAVWQGPYRGYPEFFMWLSLLAIYPVLVLVWSIFQVHYLMQNVKQNQLEMISREADQTLQKVLAAPDAESFTRLEKIMELQKRLQTLPEWPLAVGSGLALLLTSLAAIVQFIGSLDTFTKFFH